MRGGQEGWHLEQRGKGHRPGPRCPAGPGAAGGGLGGRTDAGSRVGRAGRVGFAHGRRMLGSRVASPVGMMDRGMLRWKWRGEGRGGYGRGEAVERAIGAPASQGQRCGVGAARGKTGNATITYAALPATQWWRSDRQIRENRERGGREKGFHFGKSENSLLPAAPSPATISVRVHFASRDRGREGNAHSSDASYFSSGRTGVTTMEKHDVFAVLSEFWISPLVCSSVA